MKVQCQSCANFRLKGSGLARQGFGLCSLEGKAYKLFSMAYRRSCYAFVQASDKQIELRENYLKGE